MSERKYDKLLTAAELKQHVDIDPRPFETERRRRKTVADYLLKSDIKGRIFDGTLPNHLISRAYEVLGIGIDGMLEVSYVNEGLPNFDRLQLSECLTHPEINRS